MTGDKTHKHFFLCFLIAIFLSAGLSSCVVDTLNVNGQTDNESYDTPETTISFTVFLDKSPATRDNTFLEGNIDNYINMKMFNVYFFTSEGDFLFEGKDLDIQESADHNGQWYVKVPLKNSTITDSENKSVLSHVKSYLEKENFKIAVLANWVKSNDKGYSLDWGWRNSILYQEKYNNASEEEKATLKEKVGLPELKNINEIHHLETDSYYNNDSRKKAYSFIMDGDKMGFNTEWVKYRDISDDVWFNEKAKPSGAFSDVSNANKWIKDNWNPSVDNIDPTSKAHTIYRHYSKLWQLWNFGGAFDDNIITYTKLGLTKFADEWKERNANEFAKNPESNDVPSWCYWDNHWIDNNQSNDGLIAVSYPDKTEGNDEKYLRSYNGTLRTGGKKGYYGLVLPTVNQDALDENGVKKDKPWIKETSGYAWEYIKFKAPGTGKLRVIFSSFDNKDATLVLQRGANWEMSYKISGADPLEIGAKDSSTLGKTLQIGAADAGYTVKLTSGPEDIILFSLSGSVIIHAIEFVCDDYLSGTDREGIIPTESYPIPMFGVQNYPNIDSWGAQDVLNLPQTLYLLRALAKVELYLPIGKEISHVYLRSMNRKARCETMDVMNSTGDLWKTHGDGEGECEWFNIQKYGSGLNGGDFQSWYGWFYGSWADWWTPVSGMSWNSDTPSSPQLFNPDVQRSDFCHFIRDDKYNDGSYHRYVLYVPDKSISDPNSEGDLSSSPKVCHIEYRHSDQTDYLDDNDCYRIYFTDYKTNNVIKTIAPDKYESDYEGKKENLDLNWPIMRNHIYRFYVEGSNTPQEIRVNVEPWGETVPKHEIW